MPTKRATKAQSNQEYTYHPVDVNDGDIEYSGDRSSSCCGVLELGDFMTRKNPFSNVTVRSKQTRPESYMDYVWGGNGYKQVQKERQVSVSARPASYEEVLTAFKHEQDKVWPREYGMGTAYLLPVQQNGDWGRLLEDLGWTDLGRFWNPKTRHTLHHWVCTFRKSAPKKKTGKSILDRS